jgi:hypothetical protein
MCAYGDDTLSEAGTELGTGVPQQLEPLSGSDQFIHKLHDKKLTEFHTEIEHPAAITGLDVLAGYYQAHGLSGAGRYLEKYGDRFRVNMVPYKRKREAGVIQVGTAQAAAREQTKSMQELLLGKAMR